MSMRRSKYGLRAGDFVVIAVVLLLAGAAALPFLLPRSDRLVCEITQHGELVRRITLTADTDETVTLTGAVTNVIEIRGESVRFAQSDCRDQVCVHTGTLTRAGQIAVCLPNEAVVRLSGGKESGVDAVAA